ncbi:MAG: anthranilate synthase component I family protein [Verrucomicrobiota bacterium]|nr:anthranilate synthase component I family protein [Limisphaera sp.]MDW8380957.1 anthranilate synthase component I family protein [Verrucomicrobiota bacterium]
MYSTVREWRHAPPPEAIADAVAEEPGVVLFLGGWPTVQQARFSLFARRPFLTVQIWGSRLELIRYDLPGERIGVEVSYGNPWSWLHGLWARFELRQEPDLPFPLGGMFGFWGYDLNRFLEPTVLPRAARDLGLPDAWIGFYDSVVCWDHALGKTWIVATGLCPDGTISPWRARLHVEAWEQLGEKCRAQPSRSRDGAWGGCLRTSLPREAFLQRVQRALAYIRQGHIYQVNLSQRLSVCGQGSAWPVFRRLREICPAPGSAWLNAGSFQLLSASPELFLQISGAHVVTRPIKGTRPRGGDPESDARLAEELLASPKENAELVMITDLLRNDLGRICEYGSVRVRELARVESHPRVHHLVSTVEGRLRCGCSHLEALAAMFPGGSVTGAPKVRAMQIIEELEPVQRGFFTGTLGYLGFNRESRLHMMIRTACRIGRWMHHPVGAGIVADSDPEAEYEETLAKAKGWWEALQQSGSSRVAQPVLAASLSS